MITNLAKNSGGTGIVMESSDNSSLVLTNSHVCHVVEKGGLVSGRAGSFMVTGYKHSHVHDLCLITVDGNLKAHTTVATRAPTPFYESASISGHPHLFPNVVTTGHFSGKDIIQIMKGIKPCTDEQKENPTLGLICLVLGGIPEIEQYESTLVTATIMPGSSGSGIYNENKELSGVVFAGSKDLSYAWTVPYEYLHHFLDREAKLLDFEAPNTTVDLASLINSKKDTEEADVFSKLKEVCASTNRAKLGNICKLSDEDMVWYQ
jgi:S1-C subfamily serine protease